MSDTVSNEDPSNKTVKQVCFKIHHSGKYNDSGGGLSLNSVATCHKFGRKVHIQRYWKSNINGSDGDSSKKPMRDLPEWFTKKPVVLGVEYLKTSTITLNKKN